MSSRAQHQPRPDLGVRFRSHQNYSDGNTERGHDVAGVADHCAHGNFDPLTDGATRAEPDGCSNDDADGDQSERDAVATVTVLDVLGLADRPGGGADTFGSNSPGRRHAAADGGHDATIVLACRPTGRCRAGGRTAARRGLSRGGRLSRRGDRASSTPFRGLGCSPRRTR